MTYFIKNLIVFTVQINFKFQHVINLGVTLAKEADKNHFYNGHSGLTLSMIWGNLRLAKAFLESKCFDPNQVLGEDLISPMFVLVSKDFQKRTAYENSIQMVCDKRKNRKSKN